MNIVYFPGEESLVTPNKLRKFMEKDLREKAEKQWQAMDLWLAEIARPKTTAQVFHKNLSQYILQKRVKNLQDGLYEYRGQTAKSGTIRLYFCFDRETVYILEAELKVGDNKDGIARGRQRKRSMGI